MGVHERRRIVLATLFTLVAFPAIWLFDRDQPTAAPTVGAPGALTPEVTVIEFATASTEPEVPVFLDNTVMVVAPAVIDVALPAAPTAEELTGEATFKQFVDLEPDRQCSAPDAPSGATLTVTNINNGLSVQCKNTYGVRLPYATVIAIDTDLFVKLADLVDSPVPVRIVW
jgi:hypothetical protein